MKLPPDLAAAIRSQVGAARGAENAKAASAVRGMRKRPSLEARAPDIRLCISRPDPVSLCILRPDPIWNPLRLEVGPVMVYIPSEGANTEVGD